MLDLPNLGAIGVLSAATLPNISGVKSFQGPSAVRHYLGVSLTLAWTATTLTVSAPILMPT